MSRKFRLFLWPKNYPGPSMNRLNLFRENFWLSENICEKYGSSFSTLTSRQCSGHDNAYTDANFWLHIADFKGTIRQNKVYCGTFIPNSNNVTNLTWGISKSKIPCTRSRWKRSFRNWVSNIFSKKKKIAKLFQQSYCNKAPVENSTVRCV